MNVSGKLSVLELQQQEIEWDLVINPILSILYLYHLVKLTLKHRNHLEPVHVFELMTLADMTLGIFCNVRYIEIEVCPELY